MALLNFSEENRGSFASVATLAFDARSASQTSHSDRKMPSFVYPVARVFLPMWLPTEGGALLAFVSALLELLSAGPTSEVVPMVTDVVRCSAWRVRLPT